jgi:hypothetical protein
MRRRQRTTTSERQETMDRKTPAPPSAAELIDRMVRSGREQRMPPPRDRKLHADASLRELIGEVIGDVPATSFREGPPDGRESPRERR